MRRPNNPPQCFCAEPLRPLPQALTKLYSLWVSLVYPFASKGRKMSFHFTTMLYRPHAPRISLGNSVSLSKGAWLNIADENPSGEPVIVIEDGCTIGTNSIISAKNRIHLERDVLVAQAVLMVDHLKTHRRESTRAAAGRGVAGPCPAHRQAPRRR